MYVQIFVILFKHVYVTYRHGGPGVNLQYHQYVNMSYLFYTNHGNKQLLTSLQISWKYFLKK